VIRKLLIKDEMRRLGSRAGASDVKSHPFFKPITWALLRHMKPPMIPHQGRAIDTVNFRNVRESGDGEGGNGMVANSFGGLGLAAPVAKLKGVGLDSGLATPGGEVADPFLEFNSVTLLHDGEGGGMVDERYAKGGGGGDGDGDGDGGKKRR
jgi:protein-serine/threonine kinase